MNRQFPRGAVSKAAVGTEMNVRLSEDVAWIREARSESIKRSPLRSSTYGFLKDSLPKTYFRAEGNVIDFYRSISAMRGAIKIFRLLRRVYALKKVFSSSVSGRSCSSNRPFGSLI